MVEVRRNIKVKPIKTYKKCGRTVKVYKDKEGKMKTIEKVDDNRYYVGDYSWLYSKMPCDGTGYLAGSCGKTCKKRRQKTQKTKKSRK